MSGREIRKNPSTITREGLVTTAPENQIVETLSFHITQSQKHRLHLRAGFHPLLLLLEPLVLTQHDV